MKTWLSLAVGVLMISAAPAQEKDEKKEHVVVPVPVIIAFNKAFPHAQKVKWSKEKNDFEAEFVFKGQKESAVFHPTGKLMETEVQIPAKELPKPVTDYIASHYPKKKISEAAKITDLDGKVMYEAEISGKDLIFDASGNLLQTEK